MPYLSSANQCFNILSNNEEKVERALRDLRTKRAELRSYIAPRELLGASINILTTYYELVDPSASSQNISNTPYYLSPFLNDPNLSGLPRNTQDKMRRLIELRLFRPLEALVVAKFITNVEQSANNQMIAEELVKFRVDELILLNIRLALRVDRERTNRNLMLTEDDIRAINRFLRVEDSRLSHQKLPSSFDNIHFSLRFLGHGDFIKDLLVKYLEKIYFNLDF